MRINVSFDDGGMAKALGELSGIISDFSPVWPAVDKIVADMETQQFESEGEYGGQAWEPLNPTYAARKQRERGGDGILVASGRMRRSLIDTRDPEHYFVSGPNFGEFGTRVPYAMYHQSGTSRGLPKRTVIPVPPGEIGEAIVDAFQAHIWKRLRGFLTRRGR